MIKTNIKAVEESIIKACNQVGRNPTSVKILAVTKTFSEQVIQKAKSFGISFFGENRVQEAREKTEAGVFKNTTLCLIGHLQSNKASIASRIFDEIHSVDSLKIAKAISKFSLIYRDAPMPIYLQVNIGGDSRKFGCKPNQTYDICKNILRLEGLKLTGLMTVPPISRDPEEARKHFRNLRLLREEMIKSGIPAVNLRELSMGMTSDYRIAIQEGATVVRLGTALFGSRSYT